MPSEADVRSALEPFVRKELITGSLYTVKSGKEASVYCCEAHPSTGRELVAAKIFRSRTERSFKDDAIYREGRWVSQRSLRRAIKRKNRVGRATEFATWVEHEYQTLRMLHSAGASVPEPIERSADAVLMEFIGDDDGPAPMLKDVSLSPDEAVRAFDTIVSNIRLWLRWNRVHADLSAFNVLYWQDSPVVIDFPQSVDPRFNGNARDLLYRDVRNVCAYFSRRGVGSDPECLAADLWREWEARRQPSRFPI